MACRVTPVVMRILGIKEWVKDGVNGLLFRGKFRKACGKILLLTKDYDLRKVLEEEAVETVRERVDWQESMQKLTKINLLKRYVTLLDLTFAMVGLL